MTKQNKPSTLNPVRVSILSAIFMIIGVYAFSLRGMPSADARLPYLLGALLVTCIVFWRELRLLAKPIGRELFAIFGVYVLGAALGMGLVTGAFILFLPQGFELNDQNTWALYVMVTLEFVGAVAGIVVLTKLVNRVMSRRADAARRK